MINLIPPEEKQKIILNNREKLAAVWGVVISVFLVCLILILLSVKFYILADTDYQKASLEQAQKKYQTPDFINLNNIASKYNSILAQVDSFYKKEIYFNQVLGDISGVKTPVGLYLTSFTLSRNANGMALVSLSGVSDTRDNLIIFRNNIESYSLIKNVSFSPESWINPKNANFSLTFEMDQNGK